MIKSNQALSDKIDLLHNLQMRLCKRRSNMPFTIEGNWVPEKVPIQKPRHPVKVVKEKRGSSLVTLILNLPLSPEELKKLCSTLKQRLGCGGAVKDNHIELQGDQVQAVQDYLKKHKT